jgi:hypothetical protein
MADGEDHLISTLTRVDPMSPASISIASLRARMVTHRRRRRARALLLSTAAVVVVALPLAAVMWNRSGSDAVQLETSDEPSVATDATTVPTTAAVAPSMPTRQTSDTEPLASGDPDTTTYDEILAMYPTPELDLLLTGPDGREYRYVEGPAWTLEQIAASSATRSAGDRQLAIFQGDRLLTSGVLRAACLNETFSWIGLGEQNPDGTYSELIILGHTGTGATFLLPSGETVQVEAIGGGTVPFPFVDATLPDAPVEMHGLGVDDTIQNRCPPPGVD